MAYSLGEVTAPAPASGNWFSNFASGFNQLAPGAAQIITAVRQPKDRTGTTTLNLQQPKPTGDSWMKNPIIWVAAAGLLAVVLISRRK